MIIRTLAQAKRIIKVVAGGTLLLLGVAMLVLPGPGILAIGFGLALLSAEFVWARRLLDRMKQGAGQVKDRFRKRQP